MSEGSRATRCVAILETMWDWRGMTSGAGYVEAPRFFRINSENYSGKRLYKLVGPDAKLLVTNACRELGASANIHGKGDPVWLGENLRMLDGIGAQPDGCVPTTIEVLLVCGRVAQSTYRQCGYVPPAARVIEIPHPAARMFWTREKVAEIASQIQTAVTA